VSLFGVRIGGQAVSNLLKLPFWSDQDLPPSSREIPKSKEYNMSAPAIAIPRSVQQKTKIQDPPQQDIAKLAHSLWEERGMPDGSAEEDWIEAERRLRANSFLR
jgi:hypothetical protein